MGEFDKGIPPTPREQLIGLLSLDFTRPEAKAAQEAIAEREASGGIAAPNLHEFLAMVRTPEDAAERLGSEEGQKLIAETAEALETAHITESFKGVIAAYFARAYAWEESINKAVSPERLGFLDGDGIFDAGRAQELEKQALRQVILNIASEHLIIPEGEDETEIHKPIVRNPVAYTQAIDGFDAWTMEYLATYGEDPLAGTEPDAHLEAAKRARIITDEEAEESGFAELIERLRKLKEESGPPDDE